MTSVRHFNDIKDIEDYEQKIINSRKTFKEPSIEDALILKPVIDEILTKDTVNSNELHRMYSKHQVIHKSNNRLQSIKQSFLIRSFYKLCEQDIYNTEESKIYDERINHILRTKRVRSLSGVLVITVFTSAYPSYTNANGETVTSTFSCKYNCSYCPNPPDMPRSYLACEPGVLRAIQYDFNCCKQMWGRMKALEYMGHPIDKLEIICLGGTFSSYPVEYRNEFVRDIYYAANTYWDFRKNTGNDLQNDMRPRLTLNEEKQINETTKCRIIGLTLETRPDCINAKEIILFRSYGCTRVQLGVQHLDDTILKNMNRLCYTSHFIKALRLLKDCNFKVDIHIMPNLVGATPEIDRHMLLDRFLGLKSPTLITIDTNGDVLETYDVAEEDIQADQWKLYPMEVVPWTEVEKLWKSGAYVPYNEDELFNLLVDTKLAMFKFIRVNRIVRDITSIYILAGSTRPDWANSITDAIKKINARCMCIRCREVKDKQWNDPSQSHIVTSHYKASGGDEYFINCESKDDAKTLYGFIRLRLGNPATHVFPELEGCAMIRELHCYGQMNCVGAVCNMNSNTSVQHKGLGKLLLTKAENIAIEKGYKKISVISGNGVKEYYAKFGYVVCRSGAGDFMIKNLD